MVSGPKIVGVSSVLQRVLAPARCISGAEVWVCCWAWRCEDDKMMTKSWPNWLRNVIERCLECDESSVASSTHCVFLGEKSLSASHLVLPAGPAGNEIWPVAPWHSERVNPNWVKCGSLQDSPETLLSVSSHVSKSVKHRGAFKLGWKASTVHSW